MIEKQTCQVKDTISGKLSNLNFNNMHVSIPSKKSDLFENSGMKNISGCDRTLKVDK